jgi:DNA recombination protein RmuC
MGSVAYLEWFAVSGLILSGLLLLVVVVRQGALRQALSRVTEGQDRLEASLRDHERALYRQLSAAHQAQARQASEAQQRLLVRFARLYQALERRFGEMQQRLTEDAGGLRADLIERFDRLERLTSEALGEGRLAQQRSLASFEEAMRSALAGQREAFDARQQDALQRQQRGLTEAAESLGRQVSEALETTAHGLGGRIRELTDATERRLADISGQVEKRLDEGFEKTTETFTRVLNHLTRIDEAQKKITELSADVVSLQEVLADKRSRGAFGEVQLVSLVRNVLPERGFSLQRTLSNGTRVDCLLHIPEPAAPVAIDAKFPLEAYRRLADPHLAESERARAASRFRQDVQKHIRDIATKYLIPGETAEGAVMFIPAEAVFAEIHGRFPDLVEQAHRASVWIVSPTTMMAVLTTARAVLRDEATREQVHVIQRHLGELSRDFGRFQDRMDRLARHIRQAHRDVDEVHTSARRISGRFEKIEQVELPEGQDTERDAAGHLADGVSEARLGGV